MKLVRGPLIDSSKHAHPFNVPCDYLMDVSDLVLQSTSSSVGTVYGILVGEVSPIKMSRKRNNVKYFEGQYKNQDDDQHSLLCRL